MIHAEPFLHRDPRPPAFRSRGVSLCPAVSHREHVGDAGNGHSCHLRCVLRTRSAPAPELHRRGRTEPPAQPHSARACVIPQSASRWRPKLRNAAQAGSCQPRGVQSPWSPLNWSHGPPEPVTPLDSAVARHPTFPQAHVHPPSVAFFPFMTKTTRESDLLVLQGEAPPPAPSPACSPLLMGTTPGGLGSYGGPMETTLRGPGGPQRTEVSYPCS